MVDLNDCLAFGKLLTESSRVSGKSRKRAAQELEVSSTAPWHTGDSFPPAEKLPLIAQVYDVDLEKLRAAYKLSKETREKEITARKTLKLVRRASACA